MSCWKVQAKTLDQAQLSDRLNEWLFKIDNGVRLFREGATVNDFQWGNSTSLSADALNLAWQVRLFCPHFELYARRLNYSSGGDWQLRIAARDTLISDGKSLQKVGQETVRLLGTATGNDEEFVADQNRYRRAKISYPLNGWNKDDRCGLVVNRFQPPCGAAITCWSQLSKVSLDRRK